MLTNMKLSVSPPKTTVPIVSNESIKQVSRDIWRSAVETSSFKKEMWILLQTTAPGARSNNAKKAQEAHRSATSHMTRSLLACMKKTYTK